MSSTQNPLSNKLLLYFLIILGIIAIVVWTVFLVEQQKTNTKLSQTEHEDEAREKQTNITRALIKEHHTQLQNLITRYNNTTQHVLQEIKETQEQNTQILDKLDNKTS